MGRNEISRVLRKECLVAKLVVHEVVTQLDVLHSTSYASVAVFSSFILSVSMPEYLSSTGSRQMATAFTVHNQIQGEVKRPHGL